MRDARRVRYAALLVLSIALGLGTRRYGESLPHMVAEYGGDVLWTVALYWLLALLRPRARPSRLGAVAFTISLLVELSQRYREPWIDSVRDTTVGALLLGRGFLWSDLACYVVGATIATAIDIALRRGGE